MCLCFPPEAEEGYPDQWQHLNARDVGVRIWRILKHRAVHWPRELYGHFFTEDVFVILHTTAPKGVPMWNIYVWTGQAASEADYGAGLYKAGELDERMGHEAVVHREVEGHESSLFKNYFKPITYWKQSSRESFWSVQHTPMASYTARLLRFYRPDAAFDRYVAKEVEPDHRILDPSYIFFLDLGRSIIQRNGALVTKRDILQGIRYVQDLKADRASKPSVEVLTESDGHDGSHQFYTYLTRRSTMMANDVDYHVTENTLNDANDVTDSEPKLIRVTTEDGRNHFAEEKSGRVTLAHFEQHMTCIYDNARECFVWVSERAAVEEKRLGLEYAHEYLKSKARPWLPVTVMRQNQPNEAFQRALADNNMYFSY
ncbi:hypothetical protein NP493_176g01066 [Ridgeia piscesae]|uniref:Gelsolin-like domain-containing protein n=1 Tax=Ridgeia piscesae TaxID=27915 RepID=A0AAD9P2Y7_RIDPI|nr:hypothetical protein NP493_176g01066 [Ridgeia piscesae]